MDADATTGRSPRRWQGVSLRDAGRAVSARHDGHDVHVARPEPQAGQRARRRAARRAHVLRAAACRSRCSRTTCTTRSSRSSCRSCPNSPTLYSYLSNVDHVRARGVELAFGTNDVCVRGPRALGQRDLARCARRWRCPAARARRAPAGSAIGKRLPNIPKWRANFVGTYRPDRALALSLGRPLQRQDLHDARQRRRALQHVPGLRRVVRDGRARELSR